MSLTDHYRTALQQPDMVKDTTQEQAIKKLEALSLTLTTNEKKSLAGLFDWLTLFNRQQSTPVRGLYLWGGVGRGKTWLMNLFYEELAIEEKSRIHFHHFMLDIHDKLGALNNYCTRCLNSRSPWSPPLTGCRTTCI